MEAAEEPACGGCHKTLESASGGVVVAFGNALWHVECFRCAKCRTTVSADTNLLLLADGSPVCQACSYSCHVCRNPILDEAIMTGDDSYHAACFKCRSCSRRIEELVFAKTSQGIYCMSCHNDRVARSRRHAEQKKRSRTRSRRDDTHTPPSAQTPATPSNPSNSRRYPTEPSMTASPVPMSSSPSPALLTANQPDLGKRRKSYDDGVRPLSSFFAMGPGVTTRSPSTGKTFAAQQQATLGTAAPAASNNGALNIPGTTTSRADKRRSINPELVIPPTPTGRPRGSSVGAPPDERGQLSPYGIDDPGPKQTAHSIKSGAGSMSSRAASPSFSSRDMYGPTRTGSIDTRAGSIDMHIPGQDDTMSVLGPGEGEITMVFEEPSFTLDEPTVAMEPTFVLDEPAVAMMMMDELEIATGGGAARGSPENVNGDMMGIGIQRSRSPSFGRSASPSGLGANMARGPPSRSPSPNGRASPANLGRSASPQLGRSISPNGLGGRTSPGLGRSISPSPPGQGRNVSPGPRTGRSASPAAARDQNSNGMANSAQGRGTSPLVVKSASQGATSVASSSSPYAVRRNESPAGPRNGVAPLVAKSASQGAAPNGVGGVKAPVAKGGSVNGVNGATKPSPQRTRSGARESLPPPAVPPKDKLQDGPHHQHTLSYPMLGGSGFGSGSITPASVSNASTTSITSTSTNHTSRPTHPRSNSSSSSSPVIEHAATATYGAMQLPPMRFSLSDTDFADLLKGVGRLSLMGRGSLDVEREKEKAKEQEKSVKEPEVAPSKPTPEQNKPAPEPSRPTPEPDARRPSAETAKRAPSVDTTKRAPSVDTAKRMPSVDTERRRPSNEQRPSIDTSGSAPTPEPFPRVSSEARPSVSSLSSFTAAESATASFLEDEEEFGQNTTLATPVIRLAPPATPFRERVDSIGQNDTIVRRLKEMADGAHERGSTSVKINLEFLDAIAKAVAGSQERYSNLKGRYDGIKRTSQQFIDGLSVAQSEYDKELAARRDAEAEVTRLRVQLSGQAARLTAMSAETRIREVAEQQTTDANTALRTLLRDVSKLRAERDMVVVEMEELGKKSGGSLEPLEARLEALRKQYRKDLETLKLQREGLVKEITELKEHRDIFLEETTALNARNEELAELNAQIQRQVEQQVATTAATRPPLLHMPSSGTAPTQLSLGSALKEFGVKPKPSQAPNASVSSMNTTLSMLSTLTGTTSNMSGAEEKERDREDIKVVRLPVQEPTTATSAKGGFKWLKGKAPAKESGKAAGQSDRPKGFKEHNFVQQSVLRFSRCDHCGDKMWGMQMRCSNCNVACHQRCTYSVKSSCQSVSAPDEEPVVDISPLPPSMFGRDLIEQVRADAKSDPGRMVPVIVDKCIRAVEASAMDYEGIYRKTGGSSQSKAITQLFERGDYDSFDLEDTDSFNDISSITSVMKTYFRQLPDPLLTYALHEKFVEASAIRDGSAKREALVSLIQQLPPEHYHTLRFLMLHLSRIKDCSEENLMTARNIGVVFGPTLMRSADPAREFGDMAGKALTIEWLVEFAPIVFSDPLPA
ncbi:hypothetical protein FRC07_003893 [Ceratobasidium sp. 392]|nr:hypothetical protein FRC07_003893 [Ceratobasidium sp. 392]